MNQIRKEELDKVVDEYLDQGKQGKLALSRLPNTSAVKIRYARRRWEEIQEKTVDHTKEEVEASLKDAMEIAKRLGKKVKGG